MDYEIQTTDLVSETVETVVHDYEVHKHNKSVETTENHDRITMVQHKTTLNSYDVKLDTAKRNGSLIEVKKEPGLESRHFEECSTHCFSGCETEDKQQQNACSQQDNIQRHSEHREATCDTEEILKTVETCYSDGDMYLSTEYPNAVGMILPVTYKTDLNEDPEQIVSYQIGSNGDQNEYEHERIVDANKVSISATYLACLPTVSIETESEIISLNNVSNESVYFTTKTDPVFVSELENDDREKTCNICKETFDQNCMFIEHMTTHAFEGVHCCTYCNQQFIGLHHLEEHMILHSDQPSFTCQCQTCKETFLSEFELRYHKRVHCEKIKTTRRDSLRKVQKTKHVTKAGAREMVRKTRRPDNRYKKKIQGASFGHNANTSRNKMTRKQLVSKTKNKNLKTLKSVDKVRKNDMGEERDSQLKMEKPKQIHACEFCGKLFEKPSRLKSHLITHTGIKPHQCEVCGKSYVRKIALREHLTLHTGIFPYHCDICNKDFATKDTFKYHEWEHNGIRPFSCEVCGKTFIRRSHLNEHVQIHSAVKAYECSICLKRFATKKSIKNHQIVHTEEKCHLCTTCGRQYKNPDSLKRHEKTHIKDKIKNLPPDEYSSTDFEVASRQASSATDKAELCEKCGKEVKKIKRHQQTCKGMKKFKCHNCGKEFFNSTLLHAHRMVHNVIPSHQCDYCGMYFKKAYNLKRHMRVHK